MTTIQKRIRQWMKMFGQATPCQPTVSDEKTRELRCRLLLEETVEFCQASGFRASVTPALAENRHHIELRANPSADPDLVEMADALADIKYVEDGAACALGIDMEPIDAEVHDSNMSKFWKKEELHLLDADCMVTAVGVNTFVVKRPDGKVIKSPSYRAADIRPILEEQARNPIT